MIGIGLDTAAWAAQGMLPDPRVVEQRILDLPDEEARAAGEAAVACADYWGAVAQMYQHDARDPLDAPLVVEVTDAPALALPPGPRNLVSEGIDQQQAIAGGEAMTVDEMVAVARTKPDGISTIIMALEAIDATLRAVVRGLMKP